LARPRRRSTIAQEIRTIRTSFSSIDTALQRLLPLLQQSGTGRAEPVARRQPKLKLSPARRAALKLQGQYMGYIRSLKPRQKTRVRALRESRGIEAAIVLARKLATA
jgi:hypothetical protein